MIDTRTLKVGDVFEIEPGRGAPRLRVCRRKAQLCYTLITIDGKRYISGSPNMGGLKLYIDNAPQGVIENGSLLFNGVRADIKACRNHEFYARRSVIITCIRGYDVFVK